MPDDFLLFAAVGFLAQLVDGALGMAYGLVSSTALLTAGVPPAAVSASVHAAELFTTAASGTGHVWQRNVNWRLLALLAPAGVAGGILGAFVITSIDGAVFRPLVAAYLGLMGFCLLRMAFRPRPRKTGNRAAQILPLGVVGGFLDAVGGGGWGPIVTTGLIGMGGAPRETIGTVNTTEFLLTAAISTTFIIALVTGHWEEAEGLLAHGAAVAGLIAGGVLAAPVAGRIVRAVPARPLTALVGVTVLALAAWQILRLL